MNKWFQIIDEQINFNAGKNLFYEDEGNGILGISQKVFDCVDKSGHPLNPEILVKYAVDRVIQEFCRINQYYNFTQQSLQELNKIYLLLFKQIISSYNSMEFILNNHARRLKLWLKQANPFSEKFYSNKGEFIKPVACMEYSAETQLDLLKIDLLKNSEPFLDIGCGRETFLVDYLREKEIEAYGIDRFESENPYVLKANWLEFDYGTSRWQTIVSNLGFSNHFFHHHLRENGDFETYAKKYMEILASLKIGGEFHYAPDLPFIEKYLDRNIYSLKKYNIANGFKTTIIERLK